MNILLLGSGGRECTFAWKLAQSEHCDQLYIAPGNAGTAHFGQNVDLSILDFESIARFCLDKDIRVLLPGSEDPLVAGIYDFFKTRKELKHIIVAGPSKAGAQLEGSKAFSKKFMQRYHIPTAAYKEFDDSNFEEGLAYLEETPTPIVLKADGLAAGKGVVITEDRQEAKDTFRAMIKEAQFGTAGKTVVVEQFLSGIELSVFVLTDGENFVVLPEAKDYKRIAEGDLGPNTGGMGAVSPVPFASPEFMKQVLDDIVKPTIKGLQAEGITYQGFIFFGLIKVDNAPFVIEYNCRMGDPETEVVLPRLGNDLVNLFLQMDAGKLNEVKLEYNPNSACTVMLVSQGYPGAYEKGKLILGWEDTDGSYLFHAGTSQTPAGTVTNGGRVLAITSLAPSLQEALKLSYDNAHKIQFEGKNYRQDIGYEFI